jgi:hypothetical protein
LKTSLPPRGEEVAIIHWTRLGTERVENKKPNILNEHPADPDPLQPARLCPTSQHRTNGEQQSEQLGTDPVVRLPSLKVIAVEVGRQPPITANASVAEKITRRCRSKKADMSSGPFSLTGIATSEQLK